MFISRTFHLPCLIILVPILLVWSQSTWESTGGPLGGHVMGVLVKSSTAPDTIFAFCYDGGSFRSTDGGDNWDRMETGITRVRASAWALSPSNPDVLYLAAGGYLYKTSDGGDNWITLRADTSPEPSSDHPFRMYFYGMDIHPTNPDIIYVGSEGKDIWKTTDGGTSWTRLFFSNYSIRGVAVAVSNPDVVYAGTYNNGMLKTIDGGTNWNPVNTGLPNGASTRISMVLVDPTDENIAYVIVGDMLNQEISPGTLYKTTDGGSSWSLINNLPFLDWLQVTTIAIDPNNENIIYLGTANTKLYKSLDKGGSWSLLGTVPAIRLLYWIAFDPTDSSKAYVGAFDGLYKTEDGGANWSLKVSGMDATPTFAVGSHPFNSAIAFAGAEGQGLYRTQDGGTVWTQVLAPTGGANSIVTTIEVDPLNPDVVYAGFKNDGIHKSQDGGLTWIQIMNNANVADIAVDPTNSDTVYAATAKKYRFWPEDITYQGGVFRSDNGGNTWTPKYSGISNPNAMALAIDPSNPSVVYVITYGDGVYKSTDMGDSWSAASTGLSDSLFFSLSMDPSDPQTLYVGVDKVFTGQEAIEAIFKTSDGALSWSLLASQGSNGLDEGDIENILVDPSDPNLIRVGTHGSGVFESTDGGNNWTQMSGLPDPYGHVYNYAQSRDAMGNVYYVGTCGRGIFRFGTPPIVSIDNPEVQLPGILPAEVHLYGCYPNPFNPVTTIRFSIPSETVVDISIYNHLGQLIETIMEGEHLSSGYQKVLWNASLYSSGIYIVKLVTPETVSTRKVILLK